VPILLSLTPDRAENAMNTQLCIAFVLAFSVIGRGALAEDGGAVGTPTSKAGQAIATAAHLAEAPQVEAHDVPLPEAPRQEGNGVEAPQAGTFTARLSPLLGSRP
jgi:hypothetical protein